LLGGILSHPIDDESNSNGALLASFGVLGVNNVEGKVWDIEERCWNVDGKLGISMEMEMEMEMEGNWGKDYGGRGG